MGTDRCTSASANPARVLEARVDYIPTIQQECPPQKQETEPELSLPMLQMEWVRYD